MKAETILNKMKNHTPVILGSEQFAKFAVLIPLLEKDGELHVLFEIRSHEMRRQPGEICFPGGKVDNQDETVEDAAVRETMEELGLKENDITDVYPTDYMVSPFGMMVYPYAGFIRRPEEIKPNPAEVAEVFTVPLAFFLEGKPDVYSVNVDVRPEEDFPFDQIIGGEDYNWRTRKMDEYFYYYQDKVIWGLTAKLLSYFIENLQK